MDWKAEAEAVIEDVNSFVSSIKISCTLESNDLMIFFEVVTLEMQEFTVKLDSSGFSIRDIERDEGRRKETFNSNNSHQNENVYETIHSLLEDKSVMYREAFARALIDKLAPLSSSNQED